MNKIILIASVLLISHPGWAINYFRCDQSDDCIKAYGGCGRYLSVHKRYKELYESKAHVSDRTVNCLAPSEKDQDFKFNGEAICKKNKCLLVLPKKSEKESA